MTDPGGCGDDQDLGVQQLRMDRRPRVAGPFVRRHAGEDVLIHGADPGDVDAILLERFNDGAGQHVGVGVGR